MQSRYYVTVDPSIEPVALSELKTFLRIDTSDEDDVLNELQRTARQLLEEKLNRQFINATIKVVLKYFPPDRQIVLPKNPAQSISSIKYRDTNNTLQSINLSNFELITKPEPAVIKIKSDYQYPDLYENREDRIEIEYVAGYGSTSSSVPYPIKTEIKRLTGKIYENRDTPIPSLIELENIIDYICRQETE